MILALFMMIILFLFYMFFLVYNDYQSVIKLNNKYNFNLKKESANN